MSFTAAIQSAEEVMAKTGQKELNPIIPKKAASDMPPKGLAIGLMCMINSLASGNSGESVDSDGQTKTSEAWGDRFSAVNQPEPTKDANASGVVLPHKTTAADDDIEVVECNFEDDKSTAVGDCDETATSRFSDADGAELSDKDEADADSDVDASEKVNGVDDDPSFDPSVDRENINVDNWRSVAGSLACVFESALVEEEAKNVDVESWKNVAMRFTHVFQSLDDEEEEGYDHYGDDDEIMEETADPEMWRNVASRMASVFSEERRSLSKKCEA